MIFGCNGIILCSQQISQNIFSSDFVEGFVNIRLHIRRRSWKRVRVAVDFFFQFTNGSVSLFSWLSW